MKFDTFTDFAEIAHSIKDVPSRRSFLQMASLAMAAPMLAGAQQAAPAFNPPPQPTDPAATEFDKKTMIALAEYTERVFDPVSPSPFGASIVDTRTGEELMRGVATVQPTHDPSAHGEVNTIRLACAKLQKNSLKGYTLYTTGEPCIMCTVCCLNAQLDRVVYGAATPEYRQPGSHGPRLRCADVLAVTDHPYILVGPVEEARVLVVFAKVREHAAKVAAAAAKPS